LNGDAADPFLFCRGLCLAVILLPLLAAGVIQVLAVMARLISISHSRPKDAAAAGAVRLVSMWVLGFAFAALLGGVGAGLAILAASLPYAVVFTGRVRRMLRYSLSGWLRPVLLGVPFLALAHVRGDTRRNLLLATVGCSGCLTLVVITTLVSLSERRTSVRAVRGGQSE